MDKDLLSRREFIKTVAAGAGVAGLAAGALILVVKLAKPRKAPCPLGFRKDSPPTPADRRNTCHKHCPSPDHCPFSV